MIGGRMKSTISLLLHVTAAAIHGYSLYFFATSDRSFSGLITEHAKYGRLKFLTYNSLCISFVTYTLLLLGHLSGRLHKFGSFMFVSLAVPISTIVVVSFWTVWLVFGREYIYPAFMDTIYPKWLNHATHTILLPINIIETYCTPHHRTTQSAPFWALCSLTLYLVAYISFTIYIRVQTGLYVYPYMNQLTAIQVALYLGLTYLFALIVHKMHEKLSMHLHASPTAPRPRSPPPVAAARPSTPISSGKSTAQSEAKIRAKRSD